MRKFIGTMLILLFTVSTGHAESRQPSQGVSESGKIAWELRGDANATDDPPSIWLRSPGRPDWQPVKLCETEGWGNLELRISPDDYWIAVTDGGSSLGVHLSLFRRTKGLDYRVVEQNVEDQLARLALDLGPSADNPLDHQYTRIEQWSANSKYVLFSTNGHGGNKYKIEEKFRAVYDLGKKTLSRDLDTINAD